MANAIGGSIIWNLDVNSEKFNKGLDNAKSKLADLDKSLESSERKTQSAGDIMRKAGENIATGFKEIGVVSLGVATGFLALATKAAFSASRIDELTLALHAIGKANNIASSETDNAVDSLRKNNIAYADSLQITSRFIQNELKLTDAIKLSNTAKDLAIIAGVGSSEATNMLTEAISGQSVIALRQFGIVTTLDDAYERYAKATGNSSKNLTEAQKKQALLNVVLEAGTKVIGTYEAAQLSSGKQFRSFTSRILPDFIAQIGRAFEPSLVVVVQSMTTAVQGLSTWFDNNKATVKSWGDQLASAVKVAADFIKQMFIFIINNGAIVQGVLTAMAIGLGFLFGGFIIAHASALLLFAAITSLVSVFGGWQEIINILSPTLITLGQIFKDLILPQLKAIWSQLTSQLLPALGALWTTLSPVLIPVLKFLAILLGLILLGAIKIFLGAIQLAILAITDWAKEIDLKIKLVFASFQFLWTMIVAELTKWKNELFAWGGALMNSFADGIKNAGKVVLDGIKGVLNQAKKLLEGHSPPIVGPFKEIDKWGFNIGKTWAQGMANGIRSMQLPSLNSSSSMPNISSNQLSLAPTGGGSIDHLVNIEHMEVREDSDITDIARELGLRIETSSGYTN